MGLMSGAYCPCSAFHVTCGLRAERNIAAAMIIVQISVMIMRNVSSIMRLSMPSKDPMPDGVATFRNMDPVSEGILSVATVMWMPPLVALPSLGTVKVREVVQFPCGLITAS